MAEAIPPTAALTGLVRFLIAPWHQARVQVLVCTNEDLYE